MRRNPFKVHHHSVPRTGRLDFNNDRWGECRQAHCWRYRVSTVNLSPHVGNLPVPVRDQVRIELLIASQLSPVTQIHDGSGLKS